MKWYFHIALLLFACSQKPTPAPDLVYYLDLTDHVKDDNSLFDVRYIESEIYDYRYGITHESGNKWPFYQINDLDDPIPRDSLMAPHTHAHVIRRMGSSERFQFSNMKIEVHYRQDSLLQPAIEVILWKYDDQGWIKVANTGNHKIYRHRFTSDQERARLSLETLIRYSFK